MADARRRRPRSLRTLLEELGLKTFLKTTGGKGLHVVVPIAATLDWDDVEALRHRRRRAHGAVVSRPLHGDPLEAKRDGKIFIDYLRNAEGATAIAAFSLRARDAPVATPIAWEELGTDVRRDHFTLRSIGALLARNDPWKDLAKVRQTVTAAMRKRVAG